MLNPREIMDKVMQLPIDERQCVCGGDMVVIAEIRIGTLVPKRGPAMGDIMDHAPLTAIEGEVTIVAYCQVCGEGFELDI